MSNGRELSGKTLGLVGYGGIGRLTGRLGRALGMRTIGFDPQVPAAATLWAEEDTTPRTFAEVVAEADVLTLHVPLTHATRHLIDAGAACDDEARRDPDQHARAAASSTKPPSRRRCAPTGSAARRSTCSTTSRSAPDRRWRAARGSC